MNVAICDGNCYDAEQLKNVLAKVWPESKTDIYDSAERLLKCMEEKVYALLFLDIYTEDTDGIRTGRIIRGKWPEQEIVFVSTSREFGPEAYELDALYYLVKPYDPELMAEVRSRYRKKHAAGVSIYHSASKRRQEIPYHRITYVESARNDLYIHLTNGSEVKMRQSLQDFMNELDERFLRINRGVIVNMDAVEKMKPDSCEIDGMVFMLSRRQRADCRKKYNAHIFRTYNGEE